MKIAALTLVLGVSSIALGDILMPNQAVISGEDARAVFAKIVEVTGKQPQDFRGKKVIAAKADVVCHKFDNGQTSCKLAIEK